MTDTSAPTAGDVLRKAADAICEAFGEHPKGSQVKFLDDGIHSETFRARNSRAARAAFKVLRQELQNHAEAQPIDDYGRFRPAVEWLDQIIGSQHP